MLLTKDPKKIAQEIVSALEAGHFYITEKEFEQIKIIDEFFDHLLLCAIAHDPQLLTSLGIFEAVGVQDHNAYLNDLKPETYLKIAEQKRKNLELLKKFDVENLTSEQLISYKIFLWYFEHEVAGQEFLFHKYFVNQMDGVLADISYLLTTYHPLETQQDAQNYLARLDKIADQLEQLLVLLEHQRLLGITVPHFTIGKIVASINDLLSEQQTDHIFYNHLRKKLESLDFKETSQILKEAHTILEKKVYPAYQKIKKYFQDSSENGHVHGVWALPNGQEYYAHMLKYHTTTNLTPERVHSIGLEEVAHIQRQIREILCAEGFENTFTQSLMQLLDEAVNNRPLDYANDEEGRKQCLADYQAIIERARLQLYPLFNLRPKSQMKFEAVPKHEEEGQPGAYYAMPSIDGSRPGIFFVNLRNMEEVRAHGMETLAIHEAEPGHHFQIALQQEMDIPMMRKLFEGTAFVEGWALYTEKLAYEENFYSSALSKVGHLQDELLRAVRLVVDTGIHYKKWSREQAIEYMQSNTGMHLDSVITEVERYFVLPGQACAYKIGQLKILELRQKCKDVLKEKFDIREFHDVVLKLGAAPLEVLEEVVQEYLVRKSAPKNHT